jgi:hypothetical protein
MAVGHDNSPFVTIYKAPEFYDPATEFVVPDTGVKTDGFAKQLTFIKAED